MGFKKKKEVSTLSANSIIQGFIDRVMVNKAQNKIIPNVFLGHWECDLLEITKSDYLYEYEVKITRSDFKADAEKEKRYFKKENIKKHDHIVQGKRTNYFYYIVPMNMIAVSEVPEFAGLIYCENYNGYFSFNIVKSAPKLHSIKATAEQKYKILESCYYRFHSLRKKNDKI